MVVSGDLAGFVLEPPMPMRMVTVCIPGFGVYLPKAMYATTGQQTMPIISGHLWLTLAGAPQDRPIGPRAQLLATNASHVFDVWAVLLRDTVDSPVVNSHVTVHRVAARIEGSPQGGLPTGSSDSPV